MINQYTTGSAVTGAVNLTTAGGVSITYYTDPLCCWSWAFEPGWQQLLNEFKDGITYRYCMAGLLPDWKSFHDELLSISRPIQMGPLWMQASHASGRYIYDRIWFEDPPASSYPACIAVKCAMLQSLRAGEMYLQHVRQAVMSNGINIAKDEALVSIARQVAALDDSLDSEQFINDLYNGNGLQAFTHDVQEVQLKRINRLPSLLVTCPGQQAVLYSGYKPFDVLKDLLTTFLNLT